MNLRQSMYERIQTFSFSNIDKFSTAGLVTRMTTDVMNVQQAFQMSIRICVRAPIMLVSAMVMTSMIHPRFALIFLIVIICLAAVLALKIWHSQTSYYFKQRERYLFGATPLYSRNFRIK